MKPHVYYLLVVVCFTTSCIPIYDPTKPYVPTEEFRHTETFELELGTFTAKDVKAGKLVVKTQLSDSDRERLSKFFQGTGVTKEHNVSISAFLEHETRREKDRPFKNPPYPFQNYFCDTVDLLLDQPILSKVDTVEAVAVGRISTYQYQTEPRDDEPNTRPAVSGIELKTAHRRSVENEFFYKGTFNITLRAQTNISENFQPEGTFYLRFIVSASNRSRYVSYYPQDKEDPICRVQISKDMTPDLVEDMSPDMNDMGDMVADVTPDTTPDLDMASDAAPDLVHEMTGDMLVDMNAKMSGDMTED